MHDDQLRSLLRTLDDGREPDPAYADALFARLHRVASGGSRRRTPFVLLAAAMLMTVLAAGLAIGSGLVRLPITVDASASPTASAVAQVSPTASVEPSVAPSAAASAVASVEPEPAIAGRILFAEADGMRLRSEPSGNAPIVETLRRGRLMGATGATAEADGMAWYEVRIGPGDTAGWIAAGPDRSWLRLVENGAVIFLCDGCSAGTQVVTVQPFGDESVTGIAGSDVLDYEWSPDGTRLTMTIGSEVFVMNADGSERRSLGAGYGARWSPDGARLAWANGNTLVVTDDQLVPTTVEVDLRSPGVAAWSPDGSRLAVNALDCPECPEDEPIFGDPASALYTIATDGSDLRRMIGSNYYGWTDWAPDGNRLALTLLDLSGVTGHTAYTLAAAGGEPTPLLDGAPVIGGATWAPDGSRMAVASETGLVLLDGNGANPRMLVPSTDTQHITAASWSPDGTHLLFVGGGALGEPLPGLWIVPADGSAEPRQISPADAAVVDAVVLDRAWQPILAALP